MAIKDNAGEWKVKEQIVKDPTTGLTIQFEVIPGSTARYRLRLFGKALPFGNREILFDTTGKEAGGGTVVGNLCKPAWLTKI